MSKKSILTLVVVAIACGCIGGLITYHADVVKKTAIVKMVAAQATAWETGDEELLASVLHKDVVFAYPGRRLNKEQTIEDIRYFKANFSDTKVYIHNILIDGNSVAVEWQFATTNNASGKREVVSDAVIAQVKDGQFISWKEYLDGRVKGGQADGTLTLEEGMEPFPTPAKVPVATPAAK